jgi:hypothetical protein
MRKLLALAALAAMSVFTPAYASDDYCCDDDRKYWPRRAPDGTKLYTYRRMQRMCDTFADEGLSGRVRWLGIDYREYTCRFGYGRRELVKD